MKTRYWGLGDPAAQRLGDALDAARRIGREEINYELVEVPYYDLDAVRAAVAYANREELVRFLADIHGRMMACDAIIEDQKKKLHAAGVFEWHEEHPNNPLSFIYKPPPWWRRIFKRRS